MPFRFVATVVVVVVLVGTAAGIASAAARPTSRTSGEEQYWVSGFNRLTGNPTTFVATGLFTDAGTTGSNKVTLSKGSFIVNNSKLTGKSSISKKTCFFIDTFGGSIGLQGGTGAYKGISGTLSLSGKVYGVWPRLKSGACDEASNAHSLELVGEFSGSGTVSLPAAA